MKNTKKLLALVLALMMAFSLMAVTAAAAGTEEHEHTHACSTETIQPRTPAMQCPECGATMSVVKVYDDGSQRYVDFKCPVDKTIVKGIPW